MVTNRCSSMCTALLVRFRQGYLVLLPRGRILVDGAGDFAVAKMTCWTLQTPERIIYKSLRVFSLVSTYLPGSL
ncbi:hypothetical protein BDA96_10G109300 [Sorghum bicolor]|uniref:Uncharacterized protein n=1 Tax=Sorghum bicolor TaxID=4558 RepID=A0A921Q0R8_SORBI|nr:hypothetical protein BDA96_10G109300 [Sorghum bicolor]